MTEHYYRGRVGERLNCVIVGDSTTELYQASWGALDLDLDLVAGPDTALHRIRRRCRPADDLLDSLSCEAAVLLDVLANRAAAADEPADLVAAPTAIARLRDRAGPAGNWPGVS